MFLQTIWKRRRSIILTWLFSYMTILLLPIIISVILYNESSKTLEASIHQANNSLLKQVGEVMDNQFTNVERLNFELTWNVKVQELLYSNKYGVFPNELGYDIYQITQDLKLYKSSYPFVDGFYIYNSVDDSVLLPSAAWDSKLAYRLLHQDQKLTYDQWMSIVKEPNKGFIPITRIGEDGVKRKAVAYISSYNSRNGDIPATNVIMIDQSRLLRALDNVQLFSSGDVFILNKNNQVIVSNGPDRLPDDFPFSKFTENTGLFYLMKGDQRYEALYFKSAQSDLKYVSLIPSSLYWQKAEHIRSLTYMSIIISILGGSLLTYFFLRKNYNPVNRIVKSFLGKRGLLHGNEFNEFSFIQQAVSNTFEEMELMLIEKKQQHPVMRSNFIVRLLKGKLDSQIPIGDALAAYQMKFDSEHFAVLLFYVEESEAFLDKIEGDHISHKLKLLQFIVTNVVTELAAKRHSGFVTEIDETFACLINFNEGNEKNSAADLKDIAAEAQQFLMQKYEIHMSVSISGVHTMLAGISQAYIEAVDAMEYKLVMGSKEIILYNEIQRDVPKGTETGYYYPLSVEQQLINYMKIGDVVKARQTLGEIFSANFERPVLSVHLARCLMFDLMSTMMKTLNEIGDAEESTFVKDSNSIEKIMASETIKDMQQQLNEILTEVCEFTSAKRQKHIQQTKQRAMQELINDMTRYIEGNYMDAKLNVTLIGETFDLKPTYASKLFKDHTGEGLLDFITKVRIRHAKEVMSAHKKNMGEVAEEVGFNDVNSFIRSFKKMEGITPGKYREMVEA